MDESPYAEGFSRPPNPLQRLGADVRRVRLGRKLTQKQLGSATGYSESYVSQVETGVFLPSQKFVKGCDLAFGTNGLFLGLLERVDEGDHPSWFTPYLDLERKASRILDYSSNLLMGMLQTEDYARVLFRVSNPEVDADAIEGKVAARLRRREVFERELPPYLWVVLHETCLHTVVGGPEVMAGQLAHLLTAAASPYITLQVLPFTGGTPTPHMKSFILLHFRDSASLLYTETRVGGRMHDSAQTVTTAVDDYDLLRATALSPEQSLALIKGRLKEYGG